VARVAVCRRGALHERARDGARTAQWSELGLAIGVKMRRLESTTGRNESLGGRFLAVQNLRAFVSGDQYALFEAWDPCELKP
jgi:hypothetical protein